MRDTENEHKKRESHQSNAFRNPCAKEEAMSYQCLTDSNFDKEKCALHFANYRSCQEFWSKVRSDRRRKGIEPFMPYPEERQKIKEEYMKNRGT